MPRARAPHRIKASETSSRPGLLAWICTEAEQERDDRGRLIEHFQSATASICRFRRERGATDGCSIMRRDGASFLDLLLDECRSRSRLIVVCRNLTRDLQLLGALPWLKEHGWKLGYPRLSHRLSILPATLDQKRIIFVAHANLFPFLPEPAGRALEQIEQMRSAWLAHLQLLDELDAGNFCLTLGSQAMSIFRHRFMDHPIQIHADKSVDALERKSAFGALYQPFFAGEATGSIYHYLDTNSMYPWCMRAFDAPWRLVSHGGALPVATLERIMAEHLCIATVEIETDHQHYPCKLDGRTIYPIGRFTTTLATPDLRHALDHGRVLRVLEYASYDGAHLFDSFVDALWARRVNCAANNDPYGAALCKGWMNALYGCWGGWRFEHIVEARGDFLPDGAGELYDMAAQEQRHYVVLGGTMYSERRKGATHNGFPAIMAHIAAYGRQRMWSLAANAGRGHVLFVLSDGLIVDQLGYERLAMEIDPTALGKLKEKRNARWFLSRSDVVAVLGDHEWSPGVPGDATRIEDGVLVADLEPRGATTFSASEAGEYARLRRTLIQKPEFRSGVPDSDGWMTPIRLAEGS